LYVSTGFEVKNILNSKPDAEDETSNYEPNWYYTKAYYLFYPDYTKNNIFFIMTKF